MTVLDVALLLLAAVFLVGVLRTARGPDTVDRVLGVDLAFFAMLAAAAVLAVRGAPVLADVALIASLVGFLATVGLAGLVDRDQQ